MFQGGFELIKSWAVLICLITDQGCHLKKLEALPLQPLCVCRHWDKRSFMCAALFSSRKDALKLASLLPFYRRDLVCWSSLQSLSFPPVYHCAWWEHGVRYVWTLFFGKSLSASVLLGIRWARVLSIPTADSCKRELWKVVQIPQFSKDDCCGLDVSQRSMCCWLGLQCEWIRAFKRWDLLEVD